MAKFSATYIAKIYRLSAKNLTQRQICEELNITNKTFTKWLKYYPLFKLAYESGKDTVQDLAVQRAIDALATKCTYDTETIESYDKDGKLIGTKVRKIKRDVIHTDLIAKLLKLDEKPVFNTDFAMPPVFIGMPPQK